VLDNLTTGHRWAVKWGPLVVADIADSAQVANAVDEFDVKAVTHFAAHAYVGESIQQPQKYFQNNVAKTITLLDTLLRAGVSKIIFSSSCATYGRPQKSLIDEDHPQNPIKSVRHIKAIRRENIVLVRQRSQHASYKPALL
jgi:UDP-arabinose 4-epimerase